MNIWPADNKKKPGVWKMKTSLIVSLLAKVSTMTELKQTQALIIKTGYNSHSSFHTQLLSFCALSTYGSLEYATAIFYETPTKNPFLWNTIIRAYSHSAFPIKAIQIYNQMHRMSVKLDTFTLPFVLKSCSKLFEEIPHVVLKGMEIHCTALKSGLYVNEFLQNSLLYMYSQCGLLELARVVFDEMSLRTVASWNTMITAYDRVGDFDTANSLTELMPEKNVVSWNTLIARHVRQGNVGAARKVFDEMTERDAVSWNSIIAGHIKVKDYKRALGFFREMQVNSVEVTEVTLTSVLGACAETGDLSMGREIHDFLRQSGFKFEGFLGGALVDMYAKCGSLDRARQVFHGMERKHVSCWNCIIMALAVHGYSEEALELFSAMENRYHEAVPNRVTFIGVLIACSHKGLVEQGYSYFNRMIEYYKIKPDVKHYGCLVDLLSRWGLVDEAYHVIDKLPFDANSVLWRTLLSSCRIHGNVKLAEEAFRRISELESPNDADRVLLSNIFSESKQWEAVERVRNDMIDLQVNKRPGSSQIELK